MGAPTLEKPGKRVNGSWGHENKGKNPGADDSVKGNVAEKKKFPNLPGKVAELAFTTKVPRKQVRNFPPRPGEVTRKNSTKMPLEKNKVEGSLRKPPRKRQPLSRKKECSEGGRSFLGE